MIVGIPGWVLGSNYFGVPISYVDFIKEYLECDDLRILTPTTPIQKDLNLIILPGGADINPSRYGEPPGFYTDKPDLLKEYFDVHILPQYISVGTPIFGICRGLQTLAVHFGCKLIQDMHHDTNKQDNPYQGVHELLIFDKTKKIEVNSRHHQSVQRPHESHIVKVIATHKKIPQHIEAIRVQGYKVAGVQFHPEDLEEMSGVQYALGLINSITKT